MRFSRRRTYAEDDDEDEEGVGHGEDGGGDRRDHLAQLLDAAEEPDDPQGPHQPHQPGWDGGEHHVQYGHGHDEDVQPVLRRRQWRVRCSVSEQYGNSFADHPLARCAGIEGNSLTSSSPFSIPTPAFPALSLHSSHLFPSSLYHPEMRHLKIYVHKHLTACEFKSNP